MVFTQTFMYCVLVIPGMVKELLKTISRYLARRPKKVGFDDAEGRV
jgi:hypothetical protein